MQHSPFYKIIDLEKHGFKKCNGCGNIMHECHDVLYGPYSVYKVIQYCRKNYDNIDDAVVKKIFIDTYNRNLSFHNFKHNKEDKIDEEWVFPPSCMQDNSYDYAIFWYEWIVEGYWYLNTSKKVSGGDNESIIIENALMESVW